MNKILVVNINWLGDAVFSTPVFKALRQAYPQARISCLCVPRVEEVLRFCPDIDAIIVYDEKGKDRGFMQKLKLVGRLKSEQFDAAFLLHRSMTRALLVFLAGIHIRVGYGKFKALLTKWVEGVDEDTHRRDVYLRVVEAQGIVCPDRRCELKINEAHMRSIEEKLKTQGIYPDDEFIVFNMGGNWDLKRWPLHMWAQLAMRINAGTGSRIIFSGSVKDKVDAEYVMQMAGIKAVDLAGQTSLGESLALFHKSQVVISADSGPLHLANSVGACTIGLFGPTRPQITGPCGSGEFVILEKNMGCNKAPCYHLNCSNNVCMQSIGIEDVWQAVQKFTG